jgi:quinol monooxygenase YgiN
MVDQSKVYLTVRLKIRPETNSDFLAQIVQYLRVVRLEDGCETMDLFQDTTDHFTYYLWEIWRDPSSWKLHNAGENLKNWSLGANRFVSEMNISVLRAIEFV